MVGANEERGGRKAGVVWPRRPPVTLRRCALQ